ncbi:hypothetical protein LOK74_07740 [Brevibacillus humidisoli]|uniref:hypothetical protein n=1 Tax=Brevibacillus humidisoli TaxID=2895522 RepID=UPI001E596810|nr:hypothetical protein [Brevibacillus humidisoli]UFJ42368.1 hypothetical protein LOK74_07740 [Brevibacillus humidisoli]
MRKVDPAKKSKIVVLAFLVFAIVIGVSAFFGGRDIRAVHQQEIERNIAALGGQLVQVDVVSPAQSPFRESGKGNTIYKVVYRTVDGTKTAWYRADNQSSIIKYEEAWRFEDGQRE